ncbi:MutS family DNA mismatch repair protein [Spirosoma montaniterrae]|uniref:DNA mismatch repair protein MutS n=1 Tax=Spirosoma montaniterrae TaxID=1178516 RepID=A0A1P9X1A3_9BACT|nr:MutS family DNA mismatch repair protein [Spirosoma montaniterrae]AQG81409.1 DNA mismatch repair protein MutS [Spirosoma montaniterrae]
MSDTFSVRQQQFQQAGQAAQRRYNQLAFWRILWFFGAVIIVWLLARADQQTGAVVALLAGIVGFLALLKKHQQIRQERELNRHLAFINQDEAARLNRQYLRPEMDQRFVNPAHSYSSDLDVFGRQSLFRLLNRTHTHEGENRLAQWLLNPSLPDAIHLRQLAVADLTPQLEWRQRFEVLAYQEETIGRSPETLVSWATAEGTPLPAFLNVLRFGLPAVTLALFIAWLSGYVPGAAVLAGLAAHGFLLSQTANRAKELSEQTFTISTALGAYRSLFGQAETVKGDALRLQAIRKALTSDNLTASKAIGQLAWLTEALNYRRNAYFSLLLGLPTLWDIHYLFRLERWRQQYGPHLSRWFEALAELEALNSLAGFAYAHPQYATPNIVDGSIQLDMMQVVHPLLPPDRSVANSLSLEGSGQTVLITGSNMSGKSTFLRTVGANVVLALAGAVVSAESFRCSPVRVFTSMRTQDSLEESTSSFYAELLRLKTLIKLTKQQRSASQRHLPVLYFLDEILKGTNSADRHRGAEALIRQLHKTTASGFVSTHDLELGQLTDASEFVRNYHFQSDLTNGELVFDYTLRDGICTSFNASQLMQAIGIEMFTEQQAL